MQRRSGYRRSGLSVVSPSTINAGRAVSGGRATSAAASGRRPASRARTGTSSIASQRNYRQSRTVERRRHSDYSYPGDDVDSHEHIGDSRFYGSSSSIDNDASFSTCAISNANTNDNNDVVGSILDSIDHMESQMDPVCDDSRRFIGHVPATGSANQWRHRRRWGRAESIDEERIQQQQHFESESGVVSQRNQHIAKHHYRHANTSHESKISMSSSGHNDRQQHVLPQYQTQQGKARNPYRSKGNALHTVANLMLLFSGFTIALTLLERFCVDWLAGGLPWW